MPWGPEPSEACGTWGDGGTGPIARRGPELNVPGGPSGSCGPEANVPGAVSGSRAAEGPWAGGEVGGPEPTARCGPVPCGPEPSVPCGPEPNGGSSAGRCP